MNINAYDQTFSRGPSRFVKWALSPFLLLFPVLFMFRAVGCWTEGRTTGFLLCTGLSAICICGLLALWGVRYAGRVVTGGVALLYAWYVVEECYVRFDGNLGWGNGRSADTPLNSIIGFMIIGLPCLFYTILGRFSLRPQVEIDDSGEFEEIADDTGESEKLTSEDTVEKPSIIPPDSPRLS